MRCRPGGIVWIRDNMASSLQSGCGEERHKTAIYLGMVAEVLGLERICLSLRRSVPCQAGLQVL